MPDFIFLMHYGVKGAPEEARADDWSFYLVRLQTAGNFKGASAVGTGICARKSGPAPAITAHLSGFIRVTADSLVDTQSLLVGNPVF